MTITGIEAALTGTEGVSATLAVTLETCAQVACTSLSSTAATCTIGNSASTCNATGLSVAISAGTQFVLVPAQTGTGTAAVYSTAVMYQ
jgi:hypothetical protein